MLSEVEAVSPPLSTLLGMRMRTERFLKSRLQFKCTCCGVTTTNVDDVLKPFATPSVQHRSTSFNKIDRMLKQMLKPFARPLTMRIYTKKLHHNTGNHVPNSLRTVCGFFVPQSYIRTKVVRRDLWFIVLRKSNHLQMSLQRQHFLLSYLKTLSVGHAEV